MIVKKNNEVVLDHEIYNVSSANGYTHAFLTGGYLTLDFQINDFVEVRIVEDQTSVMHLLATFENYQFSMSSYVSNGGDGNDVGSTQNGVTNNSLVFRNISILGN